MVPENLVYQFKEAHNAFLPALKMIRYPDAGIRRLLKMAFSK
jgi:hypothetical protein